MRIIMPPLVSNSDDVHNKPLYVKEVLEDSVSTDDLKGWNKEEYTDPFGQRRVRMTRRQKDDRHS